MNKLYIFFIITFFWGCEKSELLSQKLREEVFVETTTFKVWYNEIYEQPIKIIYRSTNRPTNVNRGSMDFWVPKNVKTSDSKDYFNNIYDKGHLAPAATFSDNMDNLKSTFSYLNCSLQHELLNRGEWKLLEEKERQWDDSENLTVEVILDFKKDHIILPTGGHVPSGFYKKITWETSGKRECYYFPNTIPSKSWQDSKIDCKF